MRFLSDIIFYPEKLVPDGSLTQNWKLFNWPGQIESSEFAATISSSRCQANLFDFHIHETRLGILVIMQMRRRTSTEIPLPMAFFGSNERSAVLLIVTREVHQLCAVLK